MVTPFLSTYFNLVDSYSALWICKPLLFSLSHTHTKWITTDNGGIVFLTHAGQKDCWIRLFALQWSGSEGRVVLILLLFSCPFSIFLGFVVLRALRIWATLCVARVFGTEQCGPLSLHPHSAWAAQLIRCQHQVTFLPSYHSFDLFSQDWWVYRFDGCRLVILKDVSISLRLEAVQVFQYSFHRLNSSGFCGCCLRRPRSCVDMSWW